MDECCEENLCSVYYPKLFESFLKQERDFLKELLNYYTYCSSNDLFANDKEEATILAKIFCRLVCLDARCCFDGKDDILF